MQRILLAQIVIAALIATFFLSRSVEEAAAALFGGAIALINGVLIARRITKNANMSKPSPTTEVRSMYIAVIERFVSIVVFLALGMMIWQDDRAAQFALIVGFIGGQIALMIFGKTHSA
ncbi:MAG: ATP synthase subunit I [Gammaproteobacteria bacterium]|nr:ATP synthase subunit I [Gammaproteobacteria bacterium]